jgi:hypothetical protein
MHASLQRSLQTVQFICSREQTSFTSFKLPIFYFFQNSKKIPSFFSLFFSLHRYGGLGNRLRAVVSALTVAKEVNANVVIVWTDKEHGFRGQWSELFASPSIPLGCFPGKAVREDHAKCTVHRINHVSEWNTMKNNFEIQGNKEVLCMQSMMFLTEKQRGIGWFYSLLRPSAPIADAIAAFQKSVNWDGWGQWVGVHIRRTDLKLRCNTDDCTDGLAATEVLPLDKYTNILNQVVKLGEISGDKPRFFLATDDSKTEEAVRVALETTGSSLLGSNGDSDSIVSYSKAVRDSAVDSLAMRSSSAGTAEAVIDLWLLSRARMLVGTVGSSYSQTAKLMGKNFFMSVGVEYENRL